jgi:hypothetical protein
MICCGSGFDLGKISGSVLGSGTGCRQYLAQFSKNKIAKNHAFSMPEAANFS